jgi:hypothetical protein
MKMGSEVYHHLKNVIKAKYGQDAVNVGDEGGFAPNILDNSEGLNLVVTAIEKAGYTGKVKIGMDVAASEFFTKDGKYDLNFKEKNNDGKAVLTGTELANLYKKFTEDYPVISIEDPFDQDDWSAYNGLTSAIGKTVQIVGDDLLVTNPTRVKKAIETKACNALLLKVNQIGSVTESIEAVKMAQGAGWGVMASHRSGETEDSFIADLAVGLNTGQIKTGAPCRSERLSKYNQLLRIEEELGSAAKYAGESFRAPADKVTIVEGVSFNVIAREWRCKWSADAEKDSLRLAQAELDAILSVVKGTKGVRSVQRVVCGGCLDFKVIVSLANADFHSWEATGFGPEKSFLDAIGKIKGITSVETQTYTLMTL